MENGLKIRLTRISYKNEYYIKKEGMMGGILKLKHDYLTIIITWD